MTDVDSEIINKPELTDTEGNDNIIDETKQERQKNQEDVYDVAIIGGGFSGLSARIDAWKIPPQDSDL